MDERRAVLGTGLLVQIVLAALIVALMPRFAVTNLHLQAFSLLWGAAAGVILYLASARLALPPRGAFTSRVPSLLVKSALAAAVAWAEETLWRGAIFGLLEPRGVALALGLTTVCFAAAHVFGQGWPAFVPHLLTGLTFGALYLVTGSLAAAILAHAVYNIFVVAADHGLRNSRRRELKVQGISTCS
jgi:membrane protease YdiL (CAAX protease family)